MLRWLMNIERITSCVAHRYGRLLITGALSSCLLVNIALHAGFGLLQYCQDECALRFLEAPLISSDPLVIQHIKDNWLDPPAPLGDYYATFPLDKPPWSHEDSWTQAYNLINEYFAKYKSPGTFMEIGAGDGEFLSLSLYVEQGLGFRGVLVEPDPNLYKELRKNKRASVSIQACAVPDSGHRKELLWIRDVPDDLPVLLYRIQRANNRLLQYVSQEDWTLGKTIPVQCFNMAAMAIASLNTRIIDLIIISTHGGEPDIFTSIPMSIKLKMVVLSMSVAIKDEWDFVQQGAEERNLILVRHFTHHQIFLHKDYVQYTEN